MRSTRTSRVLAALVCACLGVHQASGQVRTSAFSINAVLADALKAAPEANSADRVRVLLTLYPTLRKLEPERAETALNQAADLAESASEGDSLLTAVLKGAVQGAFSGAAVVLLGWPVWLSPAFPVPGTSIKDAGDARSLKASISLGVVETLAPVNSPRALKLASSIDVPLARAHGFNTALTKAPSTESAAFLQLVREQAVIAEKQRAPVVLAGLALGVASRDMQLGAELALEGLEILKRPSTEFETPDATYLYRAIAVLDAKAAERELDRLVASPTAHEDALLTFAAGMAEHQPVLAWRALNAATRPGDANKTRLMKLAAVLRELPGKLPPEFQDPLKSYAADCLRRAAVFERRVFTFGISTDGAVAAIDAVSALAAVDARAAREQVELARFHRQIGTQILLQIRNGRLRDRFPTDLLRLELALSQLKTQPQEAFTILESFDEQFWEGLAKAVFRFPQQASTPANPITLRMTDQLHRVRHEWPAAARRACQEKASSCAPTLQRLQQVARWLDAEALDRVADDDERRSLWVDYLPFSLTLAAEALAVHDGQAADQAIRESLKLALRLPTPSREWALAWNAVIWQQIGSEAAKAAVSESLSRIQGLHRRGVGRSWWEWAPRFIDRVARLDPSLAYALARENAAELRPITLAAVVAALGPGSIDAK